MTRYQLVFRTPEGDRMEMHDNGDGNDGGPRLHGVVLLDGAIFPLRGTRWVATRDDIEGVDGGEPMLRFICTPVGD